MRQGDGNASELRVMVTMEGAALVTLERQAEAAYVRFCRHAKECVVCRHAGGEWARENGVCRVGRLFMQAWGNAEQEVERAWRVKR